MKPKLITDIEKGTYLIKEGVIHTMTAITDINELHKELKKQVRKEIEEEGTAIQNIAEIGRGMEKFTEDGWKITYEQSNQDQPLKIYIGKPFMGKVMQHEVKTRNDTGTEKNEMIKLYIPAGILTGYFVINNNKKYQKKEIRLLPLKNKRFKKIIEEDNMICGFRRTHPHVFNDGRLCAGISFKENFDINNVINVIESCVRGYDKGTSIYDYNPNSPATHIEQCDRGIYAYKLMKEGKTDEEIWSEITKPINEESTETTEEDG